MQLRPRDGTGRAIPTNDGKLRSFTKILDQDESDDLTYGNVRGGQVYQMLKGGPSGKEYIKFKEYKQDDDTNKKVPRIRNMYTIVRDLVAATKVSGKWDFKEIEAIRKYYVGNDLLKDTDFAKILKEQKLLHKIQPDENVTDHSDIKAFVDDAIASYRKMHPNKPIKLDDANYIKFVNKVLTRVRDTYLKREGDFNPVKIGTTNGDKATTNSVYGHYAVGGHTAGLSSGSAGQELEVAATSGAVVDPYKQLTAYFADRDSPTKLIAKCKAAKIVDSTDMKESDVSSSGANLTKFKPLDIMFSDTDAAKDLKDLLEEMYKQFVRRTEKLIKKDNLIQYEFKPDGGRKHRSGGVRKVHHSRHRDGARSTKRRAGGRSRGRM